MDLAGIEPASCLLDHYRDTTMPCDGDSFICLSSSQPVFPVMSVVFPTVVPFCCQAGKPRAASRLTIALVLPRSGSERVTGDAVYFFLTRRGGSSLVAP